MLKPIMLVSLCAVSSLVVSAEYIGKIKSLYLHEREENSYFGVELQGQMDENPCGVNKGVFVISPQDINKHQFSMLLAAKASGSNVKILNQGANEAKRCHGTYSTFNFVQIL